MKRERWSERRIRRAEKKWIKSTFLHGMCIRMRRYMYIYVSHSDEA